jgi:hypothetical protein
MPFFIRFKTTSPSERGAIPYKGDHAIAALKWIIQLKIDK